MSGGLSKVAPSSRAAVRSARHFLPLFVCLGVLSSCCPRRSGANHSVSHEFDARAVAANATHTCLLRTDGTPWCFGGDTSVSPPMTPAPKVPLSRLETGRRFACGIRAADGGAVCWGDCHASHRCATPAGQFEELALHDDSGGCAFSRSASRVACWGDWLTRFAPPVELAATLLSQLVFGPDWAVALRSDGTLLAWGHGAVVHDPILLAAVRGRQAFSSIGGRGALLCLIDPAGVPTCLSHHANATPPRVTGKALMIDASGPRGAVPACVLSEHSGERRWACSASNKGRNLEVLRGEIIDAAVGDDHVCVLFRGGRVRCVGDDLYGRVTAKSLMADASWP